MTDEKIIKAITACDVDMNCSRCPYNDNELPDISCFSKLFNEILVFINSQKAEIEKLKEKNESLDTLVLSYGDYVTKTRTEAIKEFAERLKEKYPWKNDYLYSTKLTIQNIDNLVKEMVGEE